MLNLDSHKRGTTYGIIAFIIVAALVAVLVALPLCFNSSSSSSESSQQGTIATTNTAEAKASSKALSVGKTYKYNLGGSKSKEKLVIKRLSYSSSDSAYGKIGVYVNGKLVWSKSKSTQFYSSVSAKLITLKNGKRYVWVKAADQDGVCFTNYLLRWTGKKFKGYNLMLSSSYGVDYGTSFVKVSGNTITMKHKYNTATTGITKFKFSYKYSGGKLKRTSGTAGISYSAYSNYTNYTGNTAWLYHGVKLNAYTNTKLKKKVFSVSAKSKFKATQIKVSGSTVYFKISNGKKSGWIKASTSYSSLNARYV